MTPKILIIDDEADIREVLADIFADEGYMVFKAAHSEQAFAQIKTEKPDLIILDIWLENSDMGGMEILKELGKVKDNACPVLMISGHGNIEMAVKAMKLGAYDFIEKPFKIDHMLLTVERALEQSHLRRENVILKNKVNLPVATYTTESPKMQDVMRVAKEIARTDARVLILGEQGTGKSRLATFIYQNSLRNQDNMNSYLARDLTPDDIDNIFSDESLLKTTVLFEQIHCMDKQAQMALLAVLNRHTAMPRLITTASLHINRMIEEGAFSFSLYDRLGTEKLILPSLGQRLEDFPELIDSFAKGVSNELDILPPVFSSEAIIALKNARWSSNIKQLKAAIEWLIICRSQMAPQNTVRIITAKDLSFIITDNGQGEDVVSPHYINHNVNNGSNNNIIISTVFGEWLDMPLRDAREAFEKKYLGMLLKRFDGNIPQMAAHIDMERTALHRKLKTMDLRYRDNNNMTANKKSGHAS